jgi:class 3 adenylate cyclase/tetratricopeptide (TPR) repeat protein
VDGEGGAVTDPLTCPACGADVPEGFKFCGQCGSVLAAPSPIAEERKTVTTLFCDLVGFTAMSEAADPEDVDRLLREYFARATRVVESHGGTVEKFIGDAVVGVFGVPVVHEDDPERAVRAALSLLEALVGLTRPDGEPLQARCGVNTGEALVRLDVAPGSGTSFLTGDAVNTAARLQTAAPPAQVVVGALTRALSERAIVYEELPRVRAKGKAEPILAWLAVGALARLGLDARLDEPSDLVGREPECHLLEALFDEVVTQHVPRFAILVGEPGIGKSRLVRELFAHARAHPAMVTWRQGCCPSFGEEATYAALAEIVKGHAGIMDTDAPTVAAKKLEAILPEGRDQGWLCQRLGALLGLDAPEASREEYYVAWARFFAVMAAREPLVLVFEDLHWADPAMLGFVEYLSSHVASSSVLMVSTARPELFEAHPTFGSGASLVRIDLGPLSAGDMTRLVSGLLGERGSEERAVDEVVRRCGGNPFFAEQSARLLLDAGDRSALPDSVQAVIAARLDALEPGAKVLLGDAAVVGSTFWGGALEALQGRGLDEMHEQLAVLQDRRLIRPVKDSSMGGEHEFTFVHVLARDVAYGQLPRRLRAHKHAVVAEWLIATARLSGGDGGSAVAHQAATAVELAREVHDEDLVASLLPTAVEWLITAGEQGLRLDLGAAQRHYERALALLDRDPPPRLLRGYAEFMELGGSIRRAADLYRQASLLFERAGDRRAAAALLMRLGSCLTSIGSPGAAEVEVQAQQMLEADGPSLERSLILAQSAFRELAITGRRERALELTEAAIAMAGELGVAAPLQAYEYRGAALCALGDEGGLDDLRRATEAAETRGNAGSIYYSLANEVISVAAFRGPAAARQLLDAGLELAARRGAEVARLLFESQRLELHFMLGDWDRVMDASEEVAGQLSEAADVNSELGVQLQFALVNSYRGDAGNVAGLVPKMLALGEESTFVWYPLQAAAAVRSRVGDQDVALDHLRSLLSVPSMSTDCTEILFVAEALRIAIAAADTGLARALSERIGRCVPIEQHVQATAAGQVLEAGGEPDEAAVAFADAARRWHDFGVPYEEGHALLGQGRCLAALGRAPEAAAPLAAARDLFARLGARPALAETDEWLARARP